MTGSRRPRRAFLLSEVVLALALAVALLGLSGKLLVDALYIQRLATQHADRVAVMDSLCDRLRQDARAATAAEHTANTLTLHTVGVDGPVEVTYAIEPEVVRCTLADGDERTWQSRRLRFASRIVAGPRGSVLELEFIEQPPQRASALVPRSFTTAFLLPPSPPGPAAVREDGR